MFRPYRGPGEGRSGQCGKDSSAVLSLGVGVAVRTEFSRLTLDFDGVVFSTQGRGRKARRWDSTGRKRTRSYYPLFCTIAQTGQVFDVYHRPGNVHDSNGAKGFVLQCIERIREGLPYVIIEVRMDGAFFSDKMVGLLDGTGIEFTLSVPFERFVALKKLIEHREDTGVVDGKRDCPRCWSNRR